MSWSFNINDVFEEKKRLSYRAQQIPCDDGRRNGLMCLQAKEHQELLSTPGAEKSHGKDSSLETLERP
jgi:hypothetical protein